MLKLLNPSVAPTHSKRSMALASMVILCLVPCAEGIAQVFANSPPDAPMPFKKKDWTEFRRKSRVLTQQARETWPAAKQRFLNDRRTMLFVSTTLQDNAGNQEFVFVKVNMVSMGLIVGEIASDIISVRGYKAGDPIKLKESIIEDWTIYNPDGSEDGNLIGKAMENRYLDDMIGPR